MGMSIFHFWATVCKTVRHVLSDRCLSVCPVLSVCLSVTLVYCGQTAGWIKMKLGIRVGLGPDHTVLYGDPAPPRKGAQQLPHFRSLRAQACLRPYNPRPMSVVAKRLGESRCHLVRR